MSYVVCPEKITSPAPDPDGPFADMPNMPCNERCEVVHPGAVMEFRCRRGHSFLATPDDVHELRFRVVVTCPDGATIEYPWTIERSWAFDDKQQLESYYSKAKDMGYRVDVRDSLDRLVADA